MAEIEQQNYRIYFDVIKKKVLKIDTKHERWERLWQEGITWYLANVCV